MISAAKLVLATPRAAVEFSEAPAVEPARLKPPSGAVPLETAGGARSEPSGIFSNATAPGRRIRNTRSPESAPQSSGDGRALKPPPVPSAVAAALAKSQTPPPVPRSITRNLKTGSGAAAANKVTLRKAAAMGATAALLLGGWLTWSTRSLPARDGVEPLASGEISTPLHAEENAAKVAAAHLVAPRPPQQATPSDAAPSVVSPAAVVAHEPPPEEAEIKTPPVPARSPVVKPRIVRTRAVKRARKPVAASSASAEARRVRLPLPNPYKH
jgi:hypothetical protein